MRVLTHHETLAFHDVPQLFIAHDQLGTAYVCLLVELDEETHKYLCVPVSKDRLQSLLDAQLDLRHVLDSPETGEAFEGRAINGDLGRVEISALPPDGVPEHWLPDSGFFLDLEPTSDIKVVEESKKRNRAVIHLTLAPQESIEEPKITATRLSEGVNRFQKLLKWAYSKAMADVKPSIRDQVYSATNYELEVLAFAPGSFTIHMQAATQADLVGFSEIARALEILDEVSYEDQDIEKTVELVAHYGGHFATQYKKLLRFVVDNKVPVSYEWSMPKRGDSTRRDLRPRYAEPLYRALVRRTDIGREERRLVGRLTKVDSKRGTWRLLDDEDQEHTGHWDGSSRVTLAGLIIQDQRYELICEERLEEEEATGKEFTKLYLISYEEL